MSAVSFPNTNSEFWVTQTFDIFEKYTVDVSFPPQGWEGKHTRYSLIKNRARANNILISLFYDYLPGKRVMPKTELFVGVAERDEDFPAGKFEIINGRKWSEGSFETRNSGVIWETLLENEYIFYVTLSMQTDSYSSKFFREPRLATLRRVVESIKIEDKKESIASTKLPDQHTLLAEER